MKDRTVPQNHPAYRSLEIALEALSFAITASRDLPDHLSLSIGAVYDQIHGLIHNPDDLPGDERVH